MADKNIEIVRAVGVERQSAGGPGPASFYANDTQIQSTPWDLRFTFGIIKDVNTDSKRALIESVAEVRMSPQHAKRLAEILATQIQHYEASIGFIALPPPADG